MPRQTKVFRTSTGFHDAYVAATSLKAALAAWGSQRSSRCWGRGQKRPGPRMQALREVRRRHKAETAEIEAARAALERKLAALRARQDKEITRLERRRYATRNAYREALDRWRD